MNYAQDMNREDQFYIDYHMAKWDMKDRRRERRLRKMKDNKWEDKYARLN